MACDLNETWTECLTEFRTHLAESGPAWHCHTCEGVDKEAMLSAPEMMDAKTDAGCGYGAIHSLDGLLRGGGIPSAATLTGAALLDVVDIIHVRELQYLQGYALTSGCLAFPYFFRMRVLQEQNPTLHAYCRGVARCVEMTMRAVMTTRVHSDEEFVPWIKELEREEEITEDQIICELEEAACKAESPALAARLRWRKHFLATLKLFVTGVKKLDTETACDIAKEALDVLNSDVYIRESEPVQDNRFFRDTEVAYWASTFTPTKPIPCAPFKEAMQAYKTLLTQLTSLKELLSMPSLQSIMEFVEALGAQKPLLPVRSMAVIVLFRNDPSESFLYGPSLLRRVLEELAEEHGAPLYLKIFDADEELLEGVIKYRIHKTMDPLKITPEQPMYLRHQTVESVRRWAVEISKAYLIHMETMLCNRGLAHRRIMNALPQLGSLQEMAYSTDTSIFLAMIPAVPAEMEQEAIKRMPLLAMYTNQHVLHVMELLFSLSLELDLFTQGELIPALWYLNFIQRAQMENIAMLSPPTSTTIPETRINRRTKVPLYNLALTTRTVGHPDAIRLGILEASRMIADAVFVAACVIESRGLIDLTSAAKHSLVSVESIFNHRMSCLRHIRSPPFKPYASCLAAKPDFGTVDNSNPVKLALYAQKAGEIAVGAADRLKQILTSKDLPQLRKKAIQSHVEGLERTARAVGASLAAFANVCDDEKALNGYTVSVERPFLPSMLCFTLRKKETK
ncbi:hypothetical protein LSM04_005806 [Trypanosoma melophagium]|uniref:uncharacterized protein n=1 Tax=Trypanosoma melophagium TaxID=715481 RepID=UPI00351A3DBE|nr:hypothetical protein LSM04_005806 [Trypanosoma melophagium]